MHLLTIPNWSFGRSPALQRAFAELLARPDRDATLTDLFTGLPADMDQAAELLDYAKRYLLSLVVPPPKRG